MCDTGAAIVPTSSGDEVHRPTQSPLSGTLHIINAARVCAEIIMPAATVGLAHSRCSINSSNEEEGARRLQNAAFPLSNCEVSRPRILSLDCTSDQGGDFFKGTSTQDPHPRDSYLIGLHRAWH